ncbi:MAG TPA: hypothetical protein VI431_14040 [Candidatus Acidoferrum sp.]
MKRMAVILLLCLAFGAESSFAQSLSNGDGDLRVMTYNANEGTDFLEVEQAGTTTQFLLAVGQTITQVRETKPPERMQALATQIASASPMLVSLQEIDKWYTGSFDPTTGTCGATTLEFDMLQDLLGALAAQGAHYQVAAQVQELAFPPTPGLILPATFLCVAVADYNVILARTDLDPSKFQWNNPQSGTYANKVLLPTPIGLVPIFRAWVSVDVAFHKHSFRFIDTHLESGSAAIRELQGGELRSGPANTSLPVIVAMDSNAQAFPMPQDPTYVDFLNAGYNDAWNEIFPADPGLTCCQAELDNNPVSQLSQRVDLLLLWGNVAAQNIALFGADPSVLTASGLWPSDHAGVAAQVVVGQ